MNSSPNTDLIAQLTPFLGRRVRVSSSMVTWKEGTWPIMTDIRETDETVWVDFDNGTSMKVVVEGLDIELQPTIGSFDDATGAVRMQAIDESLKRYGPTPTQIRGRCKCVVCGPIYERNDAAIEAAYVAAETPEGTESITTEEPDDLFKGW